jgi:hypothetical protein
MNEHIHQFDAGQFDPAGRFPRGNAQDKPPEREIPAVIHILKERLEHLLKTSEVLRERLGPALTEQPPRGGAIASPSPLTRIGAELSEAVTLAHGVTGVLADILERLQI